jgi:hypothetical protein
MDRCNPNKKSFIIAAMVILLCLSCLTGATLALFTNDPNDGTIGIITTSGDVEIDIVDTAGVTLQNKALAFMTTTGMAEDSDILFEPGATFYTQGFRIQNVGDIPVNFTLSVSKDDSIDMAEFDEAFEVWIVKEGDDINAAQKLSSFKVDGLSAGDSSDTYYLVIKMKESVGNEFQNKTYTGIGVTVYAIQGNAKLN